MVTLAKGCAWRAVYISRKGRQVFHLGIDPTASKPSVFGSVMGVAFRWYLPLITWAVAASGNPILLAMYKVQSRVLCALDGRYGGWRFLLGVR